MDGAAASRYSSTYAGGPISPPRPDRPLPDRPPKPRRSRRGRRDTRHRAESTASRSSSSAASSASTTSTSFLTTTDNHNHSHSNNWAPSSAMLPRPDSTILPLSPRLQRPLTLDRQNFHALVRKGDVVQYWLTVEVVLRGLPGQGAVPRGHWEKLVTMARDVVMGRESARRQLVTGWCRVDEPLGEDH